MDTTVPLKCKLPPSLETCLVSLETSLVSLETHLVSFESFLVSRECLASSSALHCSNTQSQCLNTMMWSVKYYKLVFLICILGGEIKTWSSFDIVFLQWPNTKITKPDFLQIGLYWFLYHCRCKLNTIKVRDWSWLESATRLCLHCP